MRCLPRKKSEIDYLVFVFFKYSDIAFKGFTRSFEFFHFLSLVTLYLHPCGWFTIIILLYPYTKIVSYLDTAFNHILIVITRSDHKIISFSSLCLIFFIFFQLIIFFASIKEIIYVQLTTFKLKNKIWHAIYRLVVLLTIFYTVNIFQTFLYLFCSPQI